jgi:hypothetical protein
MRIKKDKAEQSVRTDEQPKRVPRLTAEELEKRLAPTVGWGCKPIG